MMHFMDIVAAICAQKHSHRIVVTASVDNLNFSKPIKLGAVVTIQAKITRSFNSSMEIHVIADTEDFTQGLKQRSNEAFFTFVAVDQNGRPIDVPEVAPESEEEWVLFNSALKRRQLRLLMAGRIKPEEATELQSILDVKG